MVQRVPIKESTFKETSEGGVLLASRCKSCGQILFPKATICFSCFSDNMQELPLSRRGKLYSYTIGRMPSLHFLPPYAVGFINMPEGVRIFAPLKLEESEYKQLRIGMEMEVVIEKLWEEVEKAKEPGGKDIIKEIIGWRFKSVIQGGSL